jgi:hypothetical protein
MGGFQVRVLGVEEPGRMYFWDYEEGEVPDGHFRLETLYSGFSAGTELTFWKKSNPFFSSTYDEERGVFFADRPATDYPVPFLGYMESGRVIESRTDAVREGDVLAMTYGHKSAHTCSPDEFHIVLPPEMDPILGIYPAQMGPIAINGLLHAAWEYGPADGKGRAEVSLGDGVRGKHVLVVGAGVIGLMTGLAAKMHGAAQVAIFDVTAERLDAARSLGLDPINGHESEAWEWCKETWVHGPRDRGADVVFQCRGSETALPQALKALRRNGAVIDMAFYSGGQPQLFLGEEFHHNGLSVRCAQVYHAPRALAGEWTRERLALETVALLQTFGEEIKQHIITDRVPIDGAPQFVEDLAMRRRHALQGVFDYGK